MTMEAATAVCQVFHVTLPHPPTKGSRGRFTCLTQISPQSWADETYLLGAVCLIMGLLVMMTPSRWSAPVFRSLSLPLSVFLAVWHACAYTATAVGPHEVRSSTKIQSYSGHIMSLLDFQIRSYPDLAVPGHVMRLL